jgi:hypothetical protein
VHESLIPLLRRNQALDSEGNARVNDPAAYDLGPAAGLLVGVVASCGLWALIAWVVLLVI